LKIGLRVWESCDRRVSASPAVIFDPYLTAAEQIGHGGDGFAAAFGAGTNGEN